MQSCDTIGISKKVFSTGENFFGKNSDRPLGEAQPLVYYPEADYTKDSQLKCTHLTIPQTEHTYAVLGCKPYWIWGFEMGVNEFGLAIGNEAQGSRCEPETTEGLLGMDILRVALERSKTAIEAIHVMAELIIQYGQNANANMLFDRRYENSYMLVDTEGIWVMETAGRQWVAKKIIERAGISNCYTIGEEYELCSPDLEEYARNRKWIYPEEKFNFAEAYTAAAPRQTHSVPRWRRLEQLLNSYTETITFDNVKSIFRDHFEGEIMAPRNGCCYGGFMSICMHALTWDSSQTAASLLFSYDKDLRMRLFYAPSVPCCSIYIPIYWTGYIPEILSSGGSTYSEDSLWWIIERLTIAISIDEKRFGSKTKAYLRDLEKKIENKTSKIEIEARTLMAASKKTEAYALLNKFMEETANTVADEGKRLGDEIFREIKSLGGIYGPKKEFLESYIRRVAIAVN